MREPSGTGTGAGDAVYHLQAHRPTVLAQHRSPTAKRGGRGAGEPRATSGSNALSRGGSGFSLGKLNSPGSL